MGTRLSRAILAVVLVGCQTGAPIGTSCERASDCASPLVCRLGRCRTECSAARDCPAGQACLINADRQGACELPAIDVCSVSCDVPLVCAAGHCRVQCTSDAECPGGHACRANACERTDVGSDAGAGDGGTDAGDDAGPAPDASGAIDADLPRPHDASRGDVGDSGLTCDPVASTGCSGGMRCGLVGGHPACVVGGGTGVVGDPCSVEADCAPGHSCQGTRCQQVCFLGEPSFCGPELVCSIDGVHGQTPLTTDDGIGLCTERCDVLHDIGCVNGGTCAFGVGSTSDYSWCRDVGTRQVGEPCENGSYQCAIGLSCHAGVCRRQCDPAVSGSCGGSATCTLVSSLHEQANVGECSPP